MALQFVTVPSSSIPPAQGLLLDAFARAMYNRDPRTHAHAERVRDHALTLARALGMKDSRVLDAIGGSALVHDVGKLGIADDILNKPAPLTPDEYEQVKRHVVIGSDLLSAALLPRELSLIVRHHHERWDGTGYPNRLPGEAIPIGARIVTVADCFDALTSWRPYRSAYTRDAAVAWVTQRRGTAFDPTVVDAFMRTLHTIADVTPISRRAHMQLV